MVIDGKGVNEIGISSLQLAKDIGVTQKTAWFMLQRIRKCFGIENNNPGDVDADETHVGGKNKNRHKDKKVDDVKKETLAAEIIKQVIIYTHLT